MTGEDLPLVEAWLDRPHVARWWTPDTTAAEEITKYRRRISPRRWWPRDAATIPAPGY